MVERKNRTLEDMARIMLLAITLLQFYWAQAVNTTCYIINHAMLRPILDKTPYELIKGRSPNLAHLRVFGYTCFIHNNGKDSLGKFDARADEGTFLGYSSRSKAYKVLNHRTGKVEESIHVKFNETLSDVPQVAQDEEDFSMPNRPVTRSMNFTEENVDADSSDSDEASPSLNP